MLFGLPDPRRDTRHARRRSHAREVSLQRLRRQATLFLKAQYLVERIRRQFNPEQARLIAAHATLCREDEVADWEDAANNLRRFSPKNVMLEFGYPHREGNLLLLPVVGLTDQFDRLRELILNTKATSARKHVPHITLIHPRNGICSDATFSSIVSDYRPFTNTFDEVSFIEQTNGGVWTVIDKFPLT